jgi:predicted nucleotidyltransferase
VLYAYRVLLSGIHLLRTREVEAYLPRLAQEYERPFLDELIAQKREEKGPAQNLNWGFHNAQLRELESLLDRAYAETTLPEERERTGVNQFLIHCRLERSLR